MSEGAGRTALTSVSCSFSLKVWRPSRNTSGYAGTCRNMRSVTAAGARQGGVGGRADITIPVPFCQRSLPVMPDTSVPGS